MVISMAEPVPSPPYSLSGLSPTYSDESFSEVSPSELSDVTPQAVGPDEGFMPLMEEEPDIGLLNELTLTDEAKKIVYGCGPDMTSSEYHTSDTSGMTSPNDSETCELIPGRPEQLLVCSRNFVRRRDSSTSNSSYNSDSIIENLDNVLQAVSEAPLHGTVMENDGMISFIAEDLEEMIRMSTPASRGSQTPSNRSVSSASSVTSSYCGSSLSGMSRSSSFPQQPSPDDIPPIDPHAVKDLETHSKRVADNLDLLMGNLRTNLHKVNQSFSQPNTRLYLELTRCSHERCLR